MTDKEYVMSMFKNFGILRAQSIQAQSQNMTGTELYENISYIPDFVEACKVKNIKDRQIGFVCRTPDGRIAKLTQTYDSNEINGDPESLQDYWNILWSNDPNDACQFINLSRSPYMTNDCCINNDVVYRSKIDNNNTAPDNNSENWEVIRDA